jgi:leucyl-tRNA synthetase
MVNGYLLLNGEKMSKSTCNFLTIRESLEQYGANATRFSLVSSFSSDTNDGNFETKHANSVVLKLHSELTTVQDFADGIVLNGTVKDETVANNTMWDKVFEHEIYENFKFAEIGYETSKYSNITFAFDALLTARTNYLKTCKDFLNKVNTSLIMKFYNVLVTIIEPVCPSWASEIVSVLKRVNCNFEVNWNQNFVSDGGAKCKYFKDVIFDTYSECLKLIAKEKKRKNDSDFTISIKVFTKIGEEEFGVIKNYDSFEDFIMTVPKAKFGIYKGFYSYLRKNVDRYGKD